MKSQTKQKNANRIKNKKTPDQTEFITGEYDQAQHDQKEKKK